MSDSVFCTESFLGDPKFYNEQWMHREMLFDRIRCEAFKKAIFSAVSPGDVVLDVGAGSGILSMFAAQAGAAKVYAVERTVTAQLARQLIEKNDFQDRVIIMQGDIDHVELPEKADVLVMEWMGGFGVDENLLPPLIRARDKWLKPDGCMIPEKVTSFLAPVYDRKLEERLNFWKSKPYDIDLELIGWHLVNEVHIARNDVRTGDLLASPHAMWTVDACSLSLAQAEAAFEVEHCFDITNPGRLTALAAWFEAELGDGINLGNAPGAPNTHWGRTILPIDKFYDLCVGDKIDTGFSCVPVSHNLSDNRWWVRVGEDERRCYEGRQGCTASPGFH
ncbi:MAG: methyltransferase domain-containing protein [Candidatus Electrothrix sp. AUS4]|nr:methyltransferase domain-containing protein [Candidatus Electrothrix sp. AUS4]